METKTDGSSKRKVGNWGQLRIVGRTVDGKRVMGGFFPVVSSEGYPLMLILMDMERKGFVPDWLGFWNDAMKAGWNPRSTVTRITTEVGDAFGPKAKEQVSETTEFLYNFEMASRDGNEDEMKRLLLERRKIDQKDQRQRLIDTIKNKRA